MAEGLLFIKHAKEEYASINLTFRRRFSSKYNRAMSAFTASHASGL